MEPGIYCLIFENPAVTIGIGRLGSVTFRAGYHVYVGSALGPGGLARVERHRRLGRLRHRRPHWHVDRLLLDPRFRLVAVVTAVTGATVECDVANAIGGDRVPGFGASDCRCGSHLFFRAGEPIDEIEAVFHSIGLAPIVGRLNSDFEKAMVTGGESS